MTSKFNLEDFQKSCKTDRHWELKREFMERYKNKFNEEKLLTYLAEVYANVILMKCRYPEPLMKEIEELSKPLQIQKQFEDIDGKTRVKRLLNEQEDTEKTSSMYEHLKRPSKQLKTFANEGQSNSAFSLTSNNLLHSVKKQFSDQFSVPLNSEKGTEILLQLKKVLKASKDLTEQASERMNFCTSDRQFSSTFSIASTNVFSVGQFRNTYPVPLYNEQDCQILSTSEPVYRTPEHSTPFKQVHFNAKEGQPNSTFFSVDTGMLQPSVEKFRNTYSIPFLEEQSVQNLSESEALKGSVEYSEKLGRQINFPADEGQFSSIFSSTSTDELQPSMGHSRNTFSIPFLEDHVSQSLSKSEQILKKSVEHSKTPFKQMNFNANEEQSNSTFLPTSIDVLQPSLEKFRNTYTIPFLEKHDAQNLSKSEHNLKKSVEHSETLFKQMKLCINEGQSISKFSPSINELQSFEKQFSNASAAPLYNKQDAKILSKSEQILKTSERLSEKSFTETNCVDKGQSSSTISTNMLQRTIKEVTNKCSTPVEHFVHYPLDNEQKIPSLPKPEESFETSSLDEKKEPLYQIKDIFIENEKADNIIFTLGLPFIQRFAEHAQSCVTRFSSAMEILQHACLKLKVWNQCSFEVHRDPDNPVQAALYYHKFYLNRCLIACVVTSMKKKKGKTLVAEAALNTLVKLATLDRSKASHIYGPPPKRKKPMMNIVQLFDIFSKNIINRTKDEPAIITLKSIASLLDMEDDCVVFKVTSNIVADCATEFTSSLFLYGILISYAKNDSIQSSKNLAAEFALIKLSNLADYVIHEGKLKNRLDYLKDVHSTRFSSSKACSTHMKEKHSFILNKNLFDSSVRDEIMLIQRDSVQINIQRNLRDLVQDSGNFCHEQLFFDFEEIRTNTPSYIKAKVRIGTLELGAGVAFSRDEARTIACAKAFINMQRRYYTLRVKDEYIEGFLVTLDQLINEESYSKNKIKKQYLRMEKIKKKRYVFKLEFPGESIRDCIEGTAKQPLSKDKKLNTETKSSNSDTKPFITESKTSATDTKPFITESETTAADTKPSSTDISSESTEKRHDFSLFIVKLEIMLQKFQESEDYCDLLFSEEFTPIHRGLTIKTLKKLHLRYLFLIDEPKTYLCVRHRYEVTELLKFLVKNGGSNCKFELIDASKTVI